MEMQTDPDTNQPISKRQKPEQPAIKSMFVSALLAAMLALLLFGPITGLVLSGYSITPHWNRPVWLAVTVFIGHFLFSWGWHTFSWRFKEGSFKEGSLLPSWGSWVQTRVTNKVNLHKILTGFGLFTALLLPFVIGKYGISIATIALIYILLALGLNIVVGLAGLLDLGFVAFYAVGAYGYALGYQYLGLNFWLALPFAAILAACFGAVLGFPVLRMHGDYLAIVTLGFGEIIRLVLNNWVSFTGGPNGTSVMFPTLFGLEFTRRAKQGGVPIHEWLGISYSSSLRYIFLYTLLLVVVCGMIYFVTRLKQMPIGRSWEALRGDEIACRSLGINHVSIKLSAFSLGAMVGGIGGVFFAASQGFVNPTSFTFFESAHILAIVVLGGMGSTTGVITSALILTILPEMLRTFSDYRVLIVGLAMVSIMIWRPRGLYRAPRPSFPVVAPIPSKVSIENGSGKAEATRL